jgi:hypothetical protein
MIRGGEHLPGPIISARVVSEAIRAKGGFCYPASVGIGPEAEGLAARDRPDGLAPRARAGQLDRGANPVLFTRCSDLERSG